MVRVALSWLAVTTSPETKETKVGPLWDDCSSHQAPLHVTVRSGLKLVPCNWAFTHNSVWKGFFFSNWCYSFEWTCRVWAGKFVFTEATAAVTLSFARLYTYMAESSCPDGEWWSGPWAYKAVDSGYVKRAVELPSHAFQLYFVDGSEQGCRRETVK